MAKKTKAPKSKKPAKAKKPVDPKRSAAAKRGWETRRRNAAQPAKKQFVHPQGVVVTPPAPRVYMAPNALADAFGNHPAWGQAV